MDSRGRHPLPSADAVGRSGENPSPYLHFSIDFAPEWCYNYNDKILTTIQVDKIRDKSYGSDRDYRKLNG